MTGQDEQLDNHQSHCSQHLSPGNLECSVPKLNSDPSNSFWDSGILVWTEVVDRWTDGIIIRTAMLVTWLKIPAVPLNSNFFCIFLFWLYIKFIGIVKFPCDSQLEPDKDEHIRK